MVLEIVGGRDVDVVLLSGGGGEMVPWPSSLNVSSRFSLSFSFFPRRLFLPP